MKDAKLVIAFFTIFLFSTFHGACREYHVSSGGSDDGDGTYEKPFRTIKAANRLARAGDTITVHTGTYREWVDPLFGGTSNLNRILYRAAEGEKVIISGAEVIKGWQKVSSGVWRVVLANTMFNDYNPYRETINGDWFLDFGRIHHTGEVYLNGKSFYEIDSLGKVFSPHVLKGALDCAGSLYQWYCKADSRVTTIWANFHDADPNKELVEINVRPTVFYPRKTAINYVTVRGFTLCQSATNWGPPTSEQVGLIGPHWSKGWIIENNIVCDSKTCGVSLGADRMTGDNYSSVYKIKSGHITQLETVFAALRFGWSRETVGSHIVRNNIIFNCEKNGIGGNLGAVFSQIYGNDIYNIYTKRQWGGFEMAGIKFHAPIDVLIKNNRVHNSFKGVWIDWEAQGIRITGNLLYDNSWMDLHIEVNHGPQVIDNNCFLSNLNIWNLSTGTAFINNLFSGQICREVENLRYTPYHYPHSTSVAGIMTTQGGDDRYLDNLFIKTPLPPYDIFEKANRPKREKGSMGFGLSVYDEFPVTLPAAGYVVSEMSNVKLPVKAENNLYMNGAIPYKNGRGEVETKGFETGIRIEHKADSVYLYLVTSGDLARMHKRIISSVEMGEAIIPKATFEGADGTPIVFDEDYFGDKRNTNENSIGPFTLLKPGENRILLWPKNSH